MLRSQRHLASALLIAVALTAPLVARAAHDHGHEHDEAIRERAAELFEALEEAEAERAPTAPAEPPAAAAPETPVTAAPEAGPAAAPEAPVATAELDDDTRAELEEFVRMFWRKRAHAEKHRPEIREALADGHGPQVVVVATPAPAEPTRRAWRIGVEAHGSVGFNDGSGDGPGRGGFSIDVIGLGGVDVALDFGSYFAFGIGQIGVARAVRGGGERWAVHAAPYAEFHLQPARWLQLYGQAGAALQLGEPLGRGAPAHLGLAPYGGTGARFFFGRAFSIGPAARAFFVTSDALVVSDQVLRRGHLIFTGGLEVHLHF